MTTTHPKFLAATEEVQAKSLYSEGPRIFISYSHKDKKWLSVIETHLKALGPGRFAHVWSDQTLRIGDNWHRSIFDSIENADIALLLVSADYLSSDFIQSEELPRLLERRESEGMLVAPVVCRPCLWEQIPWLSSMIVRPHDGRALSLRKFARQEMEVTTILEELLCSSGPRIGSTLLVKEWIK